MENNKKIDLIFMGTVEFGVPLLEVLCADERFRIPLVVTQEDRQAGRGLKVAEPLIKQTAEHHRISVFQPTDINSRGSIERLKSEVPDFFLVLGYGQIFSQEVLSIPRRGSLNVHISLLPKYRGASPTQNALLQGENETGISLIQMNSTMDAGPVYGSFSLAIRSEDHQKTLAERLGLLAAEAVPDLLVRITENKISPVPQNENEATYCKKIIKSDGRLDWHKAADRLEKEIKAYFGWPGSFTFFKGRQLKLLSGKAVSIDNQKQPGHVFRHEGSVLVATNGGALELTQVQLEGKKAMPIEEFIRGYPDFVGTILGHKA